MQKYTSVLKVVRIINQAKSFLTLKPLSKMNSIAIEIIGGITNVRHIANNSGICKSLLLTRKAARKLSAMTIIPVKNFFMSSKNVVVSSSF